MTTHFISHFGISFNQWGPKIIFPDLDQLGQVLRDLVFFKASIPMLIKIMEAYASGNICSNKNAILFFWQIIKGPYIKFYNWLHELGEFQGSFLSSYRSRLNIHIMTKLVARFKRFLHRKTNLLPFHLGSFCSSPMAGPMWNRIKSDILQKTPISTFFGKIFDHFIIISQLPIWLI